MQNCPTCSSVRSISDVLGTKIPSRIHQLTYLCQTTPPRPTPAAKNKQYLEPLSNPEAAESLLSRELGGGGSGGSSTGSSVAPDTINPMQFKRDKRLAEKDPQQYCADRCVATGNCEVYEDIYHLSPSQVMPFCTDCVLAEDEDAECSVDMLYDDDDTSDLRTKGELRP
jgi:hypothetical protein